MHQSKSSLLIDLLTLALCFMLSYGGTVLEFSVTPNVIAQDLTEVVHMNCGVNDVEKRLDNHHEDIDHVATIYITNAQGKTIAEMGKRPPRVLISDGGLSAEGNVDGEAHLDLTFDRPSEMTLGEYKCLMVGFDTNHLPVKILRTLILQTRPPTIPDVVLNFKSRLQEQNTKFAALETKLNALEECTAPAVAFTATLSVSSAYSELKVSDGHKVIYNNIIENINGDYNDTTGEFTASEAGIYDFKVHGMSQTDQQVFLDLYKYSGDIEETITGLFGGLYGQAGSGQGHEAGSTSATIHLNVGDRVYVKANWGSVMFAGDGWHTNSFSGELISSDKCRH